MTNRRTTKYLVVHVTATPPSWSKGMAGVTAMHRARGWSRPGYAAVIRRNGAIEYAPGGLYVIRNHVRGFNSVAIGVSMEGGVDRSGKPEDNMTAAQYQSLEKVLRDWSKKFPNAGVCGHRDLSPDRDGDGVIEPHEHLKACPCFDAIPWAASKGLRTANIRGVWDKRPHRAPPVTPPDARNVYLQNLLLRAGYEFGPIDGLIGKKTEAAISRFQAASGLKITGTFNAATVAHLRAMFEQSRPAPVEVAVPVMTPEMNTLIDDVSAEGRISKTEIITVGATVTAVGSQAGDAIDTTKRLFEGLSVPSDYWPLLIIAAALAGGAYIWYSRSKKKRLAREAKKAFQSVQPAVDHQKPDTW